MPLIGIEEHWTTAELTAALGRVPTDRQDASLALNGLGDNHARLEDLEAMRIATMDEQGIDVQVISVAPPSTGPLDASDAVAFSRDLNDFAAEAARKNRRLRAMATLPLADPGSAAGELERAAKLGMTGAMVYGRTGDRPLDDPAYDDLFATAARLGQPIFIHPQIPPSAVREAAYSGFDPMTDLALSTFAWGWHIEAAVAALRLITRGTFDRHPDLKIVLGHWGELLLFWQDRVNSLTRVAGLDRSVSEVISRNVFITSSGMFAPALLRHALEVTSIDQLLFSTDYPFQRPSGHDIQAFLGEFESDADRDQFTSGNAERLFGIRLP